MSTGKKDTNNSFVPPPPPSEEESTSGRKRKREDESTREFQNLQPQQKKVKGKPTNATDDVDDNNKLKNMKVVFVLGGPGSGKGTHCKKLVSTGKFLHFSAGDLLRKARNEVNEQGRMISNHIKNGTIVPGHITISLLRKAILNVPENMTVLIDGFPREMEQCQTFEKDVCPCQFVLFLECTEECMKQRLLYRGTHSNRVDDNEKVITKRFETYKKQTAPVIEYFQSQNRLKTVSSVGTKYDTFRRVKAVFGL